MGASDSSGRKTAKDCKNNPFATRSQSALLSPVEIAGSQKYPGCQSMTAQFD